MAIAIIAIFVYIFVQFYSVTHIKLETVKAEKSITYESIDTTAVIVREEHTFSSPEGVVTVPCVNDGDKVNAGGNVAMTFSNADEATAYSKYAELQKEIDYYEKLATQTISQTSSIESISGL